MFGWFGWRVACLIVWLVGCLVGVVPFLFVYSCVRKLICLFTSFVGMLGSWFIELVRLRLCFVGVLLFCSRACLFACLFGWLVGLVCCFDVSLYMCWFVCMYVCMYVCLFVCFVCGIWWAVGGFDGSSVGLLGWLFV